MKTVLRVISRAGSEYIDIPNPYNMTPKKMIILFGKNKATQ